MIALPTPTFSLRFALFALAVSWPGHAVCQCAITAVAGGNTPDSDGPVLASSQWDPDGNGPQPAVIVLAGSFDTLGNAVSRGLALYDPASENCSTLGTGVAGNASRIAAVAVTPNNDLVVAGEFTSIDGVNATNIARWDGSSWQPMGNGPPFVVAALVALTNGDVIAGGNTLNSSSSIMRWDGTSWLGMGAGLAGSVWSLAEMANGDIVAGGNVLLPGPAPLVRWDGTNWSPFAGNLSGGVLSLMVLPNGDLIAGGGFLQAGGAAAGGIARWDGTAWSSFGSGILNPVYALARKPNGDILAGGLFQSAGGVAANQIARWDGTNWYNLGDGLGRPFVLGTNLPVRTIETLPNDEVIGAGSFQSVGSDRDHIARWTGSTWRQIRSGTGGRVLSSIELTNGDLLVVGDFTTIEGIAANRVARRVNGVWQPLGSGADGVVNAIMAMPNGDIVIGGSFMFVGGVAASRIARWNGNGWQSIGSGLPAPVYDLAIDSSSQILASGAFLDRIAVWDGQAWNGTGIISLPYFFTESSMQTAPNGEILATILAISSGFVGRWNGISWQPVTTPNALRGPLAIHRNGDIVVADGARVRLWAGNSWSNLGGPFNGFVEALVLLPNRDVIAAGAFTANGPAQMTGLARWDGSAWAPVGTGTPGPVDDLRWRPEGGLFVSGSFLALNGVATASFAELTSNCPATAIADGTGCIGSNGLNVLSATSLPWVGAAFTSLASGMPTNGIAVEVLGLTPASQPISSILPQAVAGCLLLTTPDLLDFDVPTAGELALSIDIPNIPSMIGASLRQQVVPLELDVSGAIITVTSTNALALTIGSF